MIASSHDNWLIEKVARLWEELRSLFCCPVCKGELNAWIPSHNLLLVNCSAEKALHFYARALCA